MISKQPQWPIYIYGWPCWAINNPDQTFWATKDHIRLHAAPNNFWIKGANYYIQCNGFYIYDVSICYVHVDFRSRTSNTHNVLHNDNHKLQVHYIIREWCNHNCNRKWYVYRLLQDTPNPTLKISLCLSIMYLQTSLTSHLWFDTYIIHCNAVFISRYIIRLLLGTLDWKHYILKTMHLGYCNWNTVTV